MSDDSVDVESKITDAMYGVNECWEFVESEVARAHIDDAIHHLKAARNEIRSGSDE